MKFLISFFVPLLLLLSACDTLPIGPTRYYRVVETDDRGDLVAEWEVKGKPCHGDDGYGYQITAVERKAFDPPVRIRYPYGRRVLIAAAHVSITPIDRPEWMDHYVESTSELHETAHPEALHP